MYEYKKSLNVSLAITTVAQRHKALETENQKVPDAADKQGYEEKSILSAPKVEEKLYTVSFKVRATADKIRELKAFLTQGGYDYE